MTALDIGRFGIWMPKQAVDPARVALLDELGFGALWIGNSPDADLVVAEAALSASSVIVVATSIVNIALTSHTALAAAYHRVAERFPNRFLLGIGTGRLPLAALEPFVNGLAAEGVPSDRLVVGALGERAVRIAGALTAGAHPFLASVAHTRLARRWLGDGPMLVPEQRVVLSDDAGHFALAAESVEQYFAYSTFRRVFESLGYANELVPGQDDRLLRDYIVAGTGAGVAAGLWAHHDAGADHVAIQVIERPQEAVDADFRLVARLLHLGAVER